MQLQNGNMGHANQDQAKVATFFVLFVLSVVLEGAPGADAGIVALPYSSASLAQNDIQKDNNGIMYIQSENEMLIYRIEIANNSQLTSLSFAQPITAFGVAPDGQKSYVGFSGGAISVVDHSTQVVTSFTTASSTPRGLIVAANHLFVATSSLKFELFELSNGVLTDSRDFIRGSIDFVYASSQQRVCSGTEFSPKDIECVSISALGLESFVELPFHGDYNLPSPLRLFPDESRVIVGSGNMFSLSDLSWMGSIGLSFVDVAFYEDFIMLLTEFQGNARITVLDSGFEILFATDFAGTPVQLLVHEHTLQLITHSGTLRVQSVSLPLQQSDATPTASPVSIAEPFILPFDVAEAQMDDEGVIYALSDNEEELYRLDTRAETASYVAKLAQGIDAFTVNPAGGETYISYDQGRIEVYNHTAGKLCFFNALGDRARFMVVAEAFLFTGDNSGFHSTQTLFLRATGTRLSQDDLRFPGANPVYVESLQRVVYRTVFSPNDIARVDVGSGVLGNVVDSVYHGGFSMFQPLRLFPDETKVIFGSGNMFNTFNLTFEGSVGFSFVDLAFSDEFVFVLDLDAGNARVRKMDYSFNTLLTQAYFGQPRQIFVDGNRLIVLLFNGLQTKATLLNFSLPELPFPTASPTPLVTTSSPITPAPFAFSTPSPNVNGGPASALTDEQLIVIASVSSVVVLALALPMIWLFVNSRSPKRWHYEEPEYPTATLADVKSGEVVTAVGGEVPGFAAAREGVYLDRGWKGLDGRFDLGRFAEEIETHFANYQGYGAGIGFLMSTGTMIVVFIFFGLLGLIVAGLIIGVLAAISERAMTKAADRYAQEGGDSMEPRICAVSFRGNMRGHLFRILTEPMGLVLDRRPGVCEVHAMNNRSMEGGDDPVLIPEEWIHEFSELQQWNDMIVHLQNVSVHKERIYAGGNVAPRWFVEHWGPAARSCATQTSADGRGVVILSGWSNYFGSHRCVLEFLFCRCLAAKFPNSVYVAVGKGVLRRNEGYYMIGDEDVPLPQACCS